MIKLVCQTVLNLPFQVHSKIMSRLIQIIRNTFIRLEGLLYRIFGFLGQLFSWLLRQLSFLGKLLGLGESQYLQEDEAQRPQPAKAKLDVTAAGEVLGSRQVKQPAPEPQSTPLTASSTRRRPDASMDYFLKLAQQRKTAK